MTDYLSDTALILDTETTDKENGEVIELAWLESPNLLDPSSVSHCGQRRFTPTKPSTYGALATHGILDEEVAGLEPSHTAFNQLPEARFWIGHNIDFDWRALGQRPGPFRICTLALCRKHWPEVDSHSLSAMMYFLYGRTAGVREQVRGAHGALADVLMTRQILNKVIEKTGVTTLTALFGDSEDARLPRKWGFGKFEGAAISAADRGYARWYSNNCSGNADYPYYIAALKRAGLL